MRPRVFPAEDVQHHEREPTGHRASMRPRVFPAEDATNARSRRGRWAGFNEAAGIPRGRREPSEDVVPVAVASMRPRVFPAEDM